MEELILEDDASTPLTEEEKEGLKLDWIVSRADLNMAEQQGILSAEKWLFSQAHKDIFSEAFIRILHKRMFGSVWKWAGQFRTSERNIGVTPWQISSLLRNLLDDVQYWIKNGTYTIDELAVRFHHRLVWIHPFPNGNGRHSRLMTDLLNQKLNNNPFHWGANLLLATSLDRKIYIKALRNADKGDYHSLLQYVCGDVSGLSPVVG